MLYKEIPVHVEGSAPYAKLELYILDTPVDKLRQKKRPMVIICPGGGYALTSYREGEPLAMHFLNQGYHVCILRYSVLPVRFPTALLELGFAMKTVRQMAEEWKIDSENIFVQGSSAGGHLAGCLGIFWKKDFLAEKLNVSEEILKPKGLILSYPVITSDKQHGHQESFRNLLGESYDMMAPELSLEKQVTQDMPPCFIWHTYSDQTVPVENSLIMALALRKANIPVELHIFPEGEHGLSLANALVEREDGSGKNKQCESWIHLADTWMENQIEGD